MLKFINNTTKELFEAALSWSKYKLKKLESPLENQILWQLQDRFLNVWNILFTGIVDEYCISHQPQFDGDDDFLVYIVTYGNIVEIHKAIKNGRTLQVDRNLKQFTNLALILNCYIQFGLLKEK